MTIYLAGKITSDPHYREKFEAAAERLRSWPDAIVLNPAELPEGMRAEDYMAICLPMLLRAERVVFLPDWRESGGARIEHALAEYVGKPIVDMEHGETDCRAGVRAGSQ